MQDSRHIVCPSCDGVNRVPKDKNAEDARCGKCHASLFQRRPLSLDAAVRFDRHVSRNDMPVLVDFWAPWCGPCRMMAPEFEKSAALLEPNVRLVKVNTEETAILAGRYNIRSIPTLVLFRHGREIARISGAMSAGQLDSWVRGNA